jgi:hypothetical protein
MRFHFVSLRSGLNGSRTTRRPVLLVHAEILGGTDPGCGIFSHPLLVRSSLSSNFVTTASPPPFPPPKDSLDAMATPFSAVTPATRLWYLNVTDSNASPHLAPST